MKKNVLFVALIATFVMGLSSIHLFKKNSMSNLRLQNVEALSEDTEKQKGCKLHLTSICETAHNDHYLFRNR